MAIEDFDYETVQLTFDSDYYDFGTENEPTFYITPELLNLVGAQFVSASATFTYFVTSSPYNTFSLSTGGPTTQYTVTPGNYTSASIQDAINGAIGVGGIYTVVVDDQTLKCYIIDNTGSPSFTFSFAAESIAEQLGFVPGQSYASSTGTIEVNGTTYTSKPYIVSPRVVNLTGPSTIYIHSSGLLQNYQGTYRRQGKGNISNIVGKILVNKNPGGILDYFEPVPMSVPIQLHSLTQLSFYCTLGMGFYFYFEMYDF